MNRIREFGLRRWRCAAFCWLAFATPTVAMPAYTSSLLRSTATVATALDPPVASVASGAQFELRVVYAVSNGPASGLVVWVPLATSLAQDFGQNEDLQFVSATGGGQYTASAIVVHGANVPAKSVYWQFASVSAGTFVVRPTLRVPVGALNGTSYAYQAFVRADSSGASASSLVRVNSATATRSPAVALHPGEGWFGAAGTPQAAAGTTVQFIVGAPVGGSNNAPGNGIETLYQARAWVALEPLCSLSGASAPDCVASVSDITGGGVADAAFDPDGGGILVAQPAVVWHLASLAPGASFERRFRHTLAAGIANGSQFTLAASLDSARSGVVGGANGFEVGIDPTPRAAFALGDNVGGVLTISPSVNDNAGAKVAPGADFDLGLRLANAGAPMLGDILHFARLPTSLALQGVALPVGSTGRVFYSTTTDPAYLDPGTPPPVDLDLVIGNAALPVDIDADGNDFWQDLVASPPSDLGLVRWVAIYLTALPSGSPAATSRITLSPIQSTCSDAVLTLSAMTRVFATTVPGGSEIAISPAALALNDAEPITLGNATPTIALVTSGVDIVVAGDPTPVQLGFTVSNQSLVAISQGELVLTWPVLSINGVAARPEFVAASGDSVDTSNAANGEIVVLLGPITVAAEALTTLSLRYPPGVVNNAVHTIDAAIVVESGPCAAADSASKSVQLQGSPVLIVSADADQGSLAPGGDLSFTGHHRNTGTAVSSGAVVYGRVPAHTTFQHAEIAPGRSLICSAPPLDADLPADPGDFTASDFTAHFEPGIQSGQEWRCLRGGASSWVAIVLDDGALIPPSFAVGDDETWQLHLHNDEIRDDPDLVQQDSAIGTVIELQLAILSPELLPAVSATVSSLVTNAVLQASCDPPRVATNQALDYSIPNSNGTSPLQFSIISGVAPGCIVLDDTGHLRGSSALIGETDLVVRIQDGLSQQVDIACHLDVVAEVVFGDGLEEEPWVPAAVPDACPVPP